MKVFGWILIVFNSFIVTITLIALSSEGADDYVVERISGPIGFAIGMIVLGCYLIHRAKQKEREKEEEELDGWGK